MLLYDFCDTAEAVSLSKAQKAKAKNKSKMKQAHHFAKYFGCALAVQGSYVAAKAMRSATAG